ncbi:MAG: PAS domain S-box protein [Balneolaceae bacterium]|nr:MAG: PAS domain S-box protein [Balneolaceae bacterium]
MRMNLPVTQKDRMFPANANILSTTDLKGKITFVNNTFTDVSGFDTEELIGKPHNIIRHPDMPPAAFKGMWDTIKSGRSWTGIVKNRCKNGDHYWVNAFVSPIRKQDKISEYQSVRRRPEAESVKRAESLYGKLTRGEPTPELKEEAPLRQSLLLNTLLPMAICAAGSLILPAGWMVALLILLSAGYMYHRVISIFEPFQKVIDRASQIADDPVARFAFTGKNNDSGKIEMALHILESEKMAIIGRIDDMIERLSASAMELDQAMNSARDRGEAQVSDIERVAAAVEEMSATIRDVSDNAQRTSQSASGSLEQTRHGKRVLDNNAERLNYLKNDITQAAEAVKDVAEIAHGVTTILDVIKEISEQTRLLSLNATIEAASAGAAGKGFSVVADQVRSLSGRTQSSADEIGNFIHQLKSGMENAVNMMENAQEKVKQSSTENSKSVAIFDEILTTLQDITRGSEEVAYIVEQQRYAADEINQSLASITSLSHHNMQQVDENAAATGRISETISGIKDLTAHFWKQLEK